MGQEVGVGGQGRQLFGRNAPALVSGRRAPEMPDVAQLRQIALPGEEGGGVPHVFVWRRRGIALFPT